MIVPLLEHIAAGPTTPAAKLLALVSPKLIALPPTIVPTPTQLVPASLNAQPSKEPLLPLAKPRMLDAPGAPEQTVKPLKPKTPLVPTTLQVKPALLENQTTPTAIGMEPLVLNSQAVTNWELTVVLWLPPILSCALSVMEIAPKPLVHLSPKQPANFTLAQLTLAQFLFVPTLEQLASIPPSAPSPPLIATPKP